jgi:ATPase subunit of ABC transporter with duplicated ATPase domains
VGVVSHDRAFLERTITSVVEIDESTHGATTFQGGWTAYLEERALARRHAEERYATYTAERQRLSARAQQQREWADQGASAARKRPSDNDKNIKAFKLNQTERLAAKARATQRAMERLPVVDKPWEGWDLRFVVNEAPRSGEIVFRLQNAVIERGAGFRLGPIDVEVHRGERLSLVGRNGSGKTTLLGALLGTIPLAQGERYVGPGVVVGELDQSRSQLDRGPTVLAAVASVTGMPPEDVRRLLAKFGLSAAHVERRASSLSPGERTRAQLALFMAQGVNCLVLDEPTNHLDLPAIEQLEQALDTFTGTVLLVTHDRRLLEAVRTTASIQLDGSGVRRSA